MLSVILPARNEKNNIIEAVENLVSILQNYDWEIIIIDDCSIDATGKLADTLASLSENIKAVHRTSNPGMGNAVRSGFKASSGETLVIVDCDGESDVKQIPIMERKLAEGFDVVVGSRFMSGSSLIGYPRTKLVLGKVFNTLFRWFLKTEVNDLTFGFKLLRRQVVDSIKWESSGHGITAETTMKPIAFGFRVAEVPVTWVKRKVGKSKFKLNYYIEYLKVGLQIT